MHGARSFAYLPPVMTHPNALHDLDENMNSPAEIDVDSINRSLEHVNTFAKRTTEKLPQVLMYEINCYGESCCKSMTLRELLQYVNAESLMNTDISSDASIHIGTRSSNNTSNIFNNRNEFGRKQDGKIVGKTRNANDSSVSAIGELRLRDLRRLDFQFNPNEERSVLVRKHSILFAMDPIRAVMMADRLILIVPDGADSLLSILDKYMNEWVLAKRNLEDTRIDDVTAVSPFRTLAPLSDGHMTAATGTDCTSHTGNMHYVDDDVDDAARFPSPRRSSKATSAASDLPFEVHAYEALLTTVMVLETQEFNRVNAQVQVILGYFRSGSLLPIEVQEQMRNRKNDLCVMLNRIRSARHTIHQLTENDEDMALMNLTLLKEKPHLYRYPLTPTILARHDEIEELLESYLIDMNALESKVEYTRSQIQNAEELLFLRLDISRNELLIANTFLAMLACCFGLGAYVGGIFGMNLDNVAEIQDVKGGFYTVTAVSTVALGLFFLTMWYVFRSYGTFPKRMVLREEDAAKLQ